MRMNSNMYDVYDQESDGCDNDQNCINRMRMNSNMDDVYMTKRVMA